MRIRILLYMVLVAFSLRAHAENKPGWSLEYQFSGDLRHPPEAEARLNHWYRDARYGALVCLGPYSLAAGEYKGQIPTHAYAEWIQISAKIPAEEYRRELAAKFNPTELDADEWAKTFKEVGLKYVVLTAKFHDGFALYDSKVSDFDVMDTSPFKRDIIKEVSEACHRQGLKFGIYYSQAFDWEQPNAPFPPGRGTVQMIHPDLPDDYQPDMDKYLEAKAYPQIEELVKNYEIDLIWFDTPIGMNEDRAKRFVSIVRKYRPDCVISSRLLLGNRTKILQGHLELVDYISLPDKKISDHKLPLTFECPDSVCTSYGYKEHGSHIYHTEKELMERFVHTVCAGGNYLLNCGIMPNGKIDPQAVELYRAIGKWMKHSGESLTAVLANPFSERPEWGDISASKSGDVLYLHILKWPADNKITLTGISSAVNKLSFLSSSDSKPEFKKSGRLLNITLPPKPVDALNTVIKVEVTSLFQAR